MASLGTVTVAVHLDIDLNGEPITRMVEMPATYENRVHDEPRGLSVHLHLDGKQLAKALLPELVQLIREQSGVRSDYRVR